jgi:hypothetical protein
MRSTIGISLYNNKEYDDGCDYVFNKTQPGRSGHQCSAALTLDTRAEA